MNKIKEKVRKLSLDTRLKVKFEQIALSERQMRLMEYIADQGKRQWLNLKINTNGV